MNSTLKFTYIIAPCADMRKEPDQEAELVSQAYFSEEITILEERDGWLRIQTQVDAYTGWTKKEATCERPDAYKVSSRVNRCCAHVYKVPDTIYGPMLSLPFESQLNVVDQSDPRWIKIMLPDDRQAFIQRGDIDFSFDGVLNNEEMISLSYRFLGLPYTWGGRTSFGYDCSGFTQMLYRQRKIKIPRDAKDQIQWGGFKTISIEKASPGDLIFFGLAEDKIRHVGLLVANGKFIHATVGDNAPYVHISELSQSEWNGSGRFTFRAARTLNSLYF